MKNTLPINPKKRAAEILYNCQLTCRERERQFAIQDSIAMVNQIIISLEDFGATKQQLYFWIKVKNELQKNNHQNTER